MARTRSSLSGICCTALLSECVERSGDLACGQQLDGGFQSRVFLTHDLIEPGSVHPGFLQLLKRAPRFDALMLADIADQKHAVIGAEPCKKLAHLVRAGKARFIDYVEVLLRLLVGICSAGEEPLQGSGFDARLIQLARGAGGRGKALNLIALLFRGAADDCERGCLARAGEALDSLDEIRRTEDIFDHALLCPVEMWVMVGNGDGARTGKNRLDMILSLTHPAENFLFRCNGFGSGELTARNALRPLDYLKFSGS